MKKLFSSSLKSCKPGRIMLTRIAAAMLFSPFIFAASAPSFASAPKSLNAEAGGLYVPISRSELVIVPHDISEVIVADPTIADVHVIGAKHVVFVGMRIGRTNAKLFDKDNHIIRQFDIVVGYDLPGIRKALHTFLPHEHIAVELVNTNIALVGEVSDASVAEKAVTIVSQFVGQKSGGSGQGGQGGQGGMGAGNFAQAAQGTGGSQNGGQGQGGQGGQGSSFQGGSGNGSTSNASIINLLKIISGQQVMLHVRVGEIQRNALKELGVELSGVGASNNIIGGSEGGQQTFIVPNANTLPSYNAGLQILNPAYAGFDGGVLEAILTKGKNALGVSLDALETEGLLKTLAEPDLVAMSGEKAEFLAGGELAIPVVQPGGSTGVPLTTVQFQPFGVAVQFIPFVLSENRIRLSVEPEVSAIDKTNGTTANGATIPGLDTRRVKTTVELAPGESFMIAGLISDSLNSSISQVPGASEIPILGALLRSTSFQRNETELVIAVTPYIVDPVKSSDVRLPTDDFRPASVMEQLFYGALGSMSGNAYRLSQTPSLEGPIGFMTD